MKDFSKHVKFVERAMVLAERGRGSVSPNPVVGAVLVRKGKIIAQDWHRKFGEGHAERNLLAKFDQKIRSTDTLYVSLEPCCHRNKKTAPCTDIILEKGVKKVVVGVLDPNPEVAGKGIKLLRRKGVEVTVIASAAKQSLSSLKSAKDCFVTRNDISKLLQDLHWQNRFFFTWVKKSMPWVSLKIAQSLDGRTGKNRGEQMWLTGEKSRKHVHQMRAQYDAILVGVKTVIADDPRLTVRLGNDQFPKSNVQTMSKSKNSMFKKDSWSLGSGHWSFQPRAVILDAALSIPITSNVVRPGTIIFCGRQFRRRKSRKEQLIDKGCIVLEADTDPQGYLNLREILAELAARGIASLYVEGGPSVWSSFLEQKLVDELMIYFAPRLLGAGVAAVETIHELSLPSASVRYREMKVLGDDVYWQGTF